MRLAAKATPFRQLATCFESVLLVEARSKRSDVTDLEF